MNDQMSGGDAEFAAMQTVYKVLESLDDDARGRVINYIIARLEIATQPIRNNRAADDQGGEADEPDLEGKQAEAPKFESLAELFNAAGSPKANSDKALVAGYWLQVCQGAESFDGFSANKELKHLGERLVNITSAIDTLKIQKPALALQLKKSGSSQQARKTYKLTIAGIKAVEKMING